MHAFFYCQTSVHAGHALLGYVQALVPHLSPEAALRLELGSDLCDEEKLALLCVLATGLKYIWDVRKEKKQITLFKMRAEIEAKISLLRKTRYQGSANIMLEMLNR